MSLVWTGWQDDGCAQPFITPYVHWLKEVTFGGVEEKDGLSIAELPLSRRAAEISGRGSQPAPLPPIARPPSGATILDDPMVRLTWMPDVDCAIVGVIDSGIALSHARFRRLDGGTRFLSAWLQGGEWRDRSAVPFGRELFRTEIDQLMFHAVAAGAIDEAQFDREAGATQYQTALGDRRLDNRGTHGTFAADLAAGYDLRDSEQDELRRRLPIIAVGLPPNTSMGSSGHFLEFFAAHAIEYVIDRAAQIWKACDLPEDKAFPLVINLSYGLQAGPKDGQMLIEQVIRKATEEAAAKNLPIRVILPAGNDLANQGAAKFDFADGKTEETIGWRIKPEDQTPNFAEFWSDEIKGEPHAQQHTHGLALSPPSGPASTFDKGYHGQMNTLLDDGKPIARIYCRRHESGADAHRMGYILCVAPSLRSDRSLAAPAGKWSWKITSDDSRIGYAHVQSDQSLTYGSETGLLSYFTDPVFERRNEQGRMIDVASYAPVPVDTDTTPPMRRRGTLNAIASLKEARVIGAFRKTDGKPAIYSNAGDPNPVGDSRDAPSCLMPGEEGAAHFGLMAAGAKSGSATVASGTSFSTALATRAVSQAMLKWISDGRQGEAPGTESWFANLASDEEAKADWPGECVPEKAGAGRIRTDSTGRMPRRFLPEDPIVPVS